MNNSDLPLVFLPMRFFKHRSKIDPLFRIAFSPNIKNPCFVCKETKALEEMEHPEMLFPEGIAPIDLELVEV